MTSAPPTTAPPATAPPATTGTTATTEEERVVEAYRRLWVEIVAANNPPDPDSPGLAEVATGEMLEKTREQVRSNLSAGKGTHYATPSRFKIVASRVAVTGDNAELEGCMTDDLVSVRLSDGTPLNSKLVSRTVKARLSRIDGNWRTAANRYLQTFEGTEECV